MGVFLFNNNYLLLVHVMTGIYFHKITFGRNIVKRIGIFICAGQYGA